MHSLHQFFLFASGYYLSLLNRCPSERQKVAGIGATIFFTAVLAMLSASYAFWVIFQSYAAAIGFGILWGLMIFNLDRFIVSSIRKNGNFWAEFRIASPRILFAILLAIVIAKPLELKVFEREINRKLDEQRVEFFKSTKASLEKGFTELEQLRAEKLIWEQGVVSAQNYRDKLQQEYDMERFGVKSGASSGVPGIGANAKKKELQLDEAERQLIDLKKYTQSKQDSLDRQIAGLEALKSKELEKVQPSIDGFDGLGARMEALSSISQEYPTIGLASLMITLLLIALECAPILVKLLAPKGPYDELLILTEQQVSVYVKEKSHKLVKSSEDRIVKFEEGLIS